jgi:predicted DNA-binding WGR domain protein
METLTNIDPAQNRHRFYILRVMQNLLGDWSLLREWGHVGSPGTVRCDSFDNEQQAREAERRLFGVRQRHGYTDRPA